MALTVLRSNVTRMPGPNGRVRQWGVAQWTTTAQSGSIPVQMSLVEVVNLNFITAPASDEALHCDDIPAGGVYAVPATGVITAKRIGTPTSGALFSFDITGM